MAESIGMKFVVWERLNKAGKWCPFSAETSHLLEQNFKKKVEDVCLGDAEENLKIYSVNLKDMVQTSQSTGTKSTVRRSFYDSSSTFCKEFIWQWSDSQNVWHPYDIDVNNFIEKAFTQGVRGVALKKAFRGYNYEIDFIKMSQINKQTKRKRSIRRNQSTSPYPAAQCSNDTNKVKAISTASESPNNTKDTKYSELAKDVPGTDALVAQVNQYMMNVKGTYTAGNGVNANSSANSAQAFGFPNASYVGAAQNGLSPNSASNNISTAALVNGKPWHDHWPPHTHQSLIKPVPGINPLPKSDKKPKKKKKVKRGSNVEVDSEIVDVFEEHTKTVEPATSKASEDDCIICCEPLSEGSSYDGDASVVQLKLCSHIFHRSCLSAMYNSGSKDKCIQCPVCKKIHGVKCGTQPPGDMIYHVLPYSLPSFHGCDTIRIIYDIPSGTQGPGHPNPGKKYTARGFPRHCYIPDNEMGRKVLRLLIKAWNRGLIFTIGTSSTTGEENTVTWNEIHHKTEFGCNRRGHGFPDPNYFANVLSELESHGVKDDEVYLWHPA